VIEYDLVAQLSLFKDIGSAFKRGASAVGAALAAIWPILLAIGCAIVVVLGVRRRRASDAPATPRAKPRVRSPVAASYDRVVRLLAKAGIRRDPATTPRELADGLARRGSAAAPPLGELTELYYAAEWGGRITPVDARRASDLVSQIRELLRADVEKLRHASHH
jgi:hypothetical protein